MYAVKGRTEITYDNGDCFDRHPDCIHLVWPQVASVGSFLMALTTLSFLITTPEAWVPALGDSAHGFPFLSATGRLVVKDAIMLRRGNDNGGLGYLQRSARVK